MKRKTLFGGAVAITALVLLVVVLGGGRQTHQRSLYQADTEVYAPCPS
jgi:hypothetical protein